MSAAPRERELADAYAPPAASLATREAPATIEPVNGVGVPLDTTPTFELEMLVSGAALVGVVQLLGASDGWLRAAMAADGSTRFVPFLVVVLAKVLLYALTGTFVIHLAARAYWVGLIGLDSVFPGGPRWERLKMSGPYRRSELARTIARPRAIAARIDNVASTLFSAGFLLALLALLSVLVAAPALGLGLLAERLTDGRVQMLTVYVVCISLVSATFVLPLWTDRVLGRRIDPASWAGRALARAVHVAVTASGTRITGPIYLTLVTNVRARIALPLVYLSFAGAMAGALRDVSTVANGARAEHPFVPADLAGGVDPLRYDALRSSGADRGRQPSVQSDVIDGPYVRLFVPLGRSPVISRVMARQCPGLRPVQDGADSLAAARQLACLAAIYATTLDGAPVSAPAHFAAAADESSLGIVRYIPTSDLRMGEHVLRVAALPDEKGRPRPPRTIPFWR